MKWKTKSGQIIDLKDMSDSHLENSIAMLERQLVEDPGEQYYTGDSIYAEEAVELENLHNRQLRESINQSLDLLNTEKQRRVTQRTSE